MEKETFLVEIIEQKTRVIEITAYSSGYAYEDVDHLIKRCPLVDPSTTFTIKSITPKPKE